MLFPPSRSTTFALVGGLYQDGRLLTLPPGSQGGGCRIVSCQVVSCCIVLDLCVLFGWIDGYPILLSHCCSPNRTELNGPAFTVTVSRYYRQSRGGCGGWIEGGMYEWLVVPLDGRNRLISPSMNRSTNPGWLCRSTDGNRSSGGGSAGLLT